MANQENAAKEKAMELAEDARQKEWKFPSVTAELFRGNLRWDLMHPYPLQDPEDKRIGDEYIAKVVEVLERCVDPIRIDREGRFPKEAIQALAEIGIFGMKIGKEYGGLGLSQTNYSRVLSVIGSYCQSTTTWVSAHQSIGVPQPLKMYGTDEQKKKYLPRLAKGEISAFALTEPDVGSDPAKMSTTATPSDDGSYYLINGEKLWCTNGPDADILVVMAKTPPKIVNGKEKTQITAFIVEKSMPGFTVEHVCSFMGLRGLSNGLLRFNNVKVPKENIIGKPGDGLRIALGTLNTGRLGIPAASAGVLKRCLTIAQQWCNDRVQWGVPIGKHQSIARKIANLAADTFAMESIVWLACSFADRSNADIRLEAAIAKYFCTEVAWKNLDEFLQVRGGRGYESAYSLYHRGEQPAAVEQWMRDARVARIFEGSSEIMHLIMAREALDTHFSLAMPIMKPQPGQKKSQALLKAARFYATWYPKQWLPASVDFNTKYLNGSNQAHLAYVARACKRLARTIFHTMVKFGPKLEFEQLILANFVDIGVDLFAMAATLAYAEAQLAQNPNDQSAQELADLFCKNARKRIAENFRNVKDNHNRMFNKVGDGVMEGRYRWLVRDIIDDYPPAYRDYASKLDVLAELDMPVSVK